MDDQQSGLHPDNGTNSPTSRSARAARDDQRHMQAFAPVRGRHGVAACSIELGNLRAPEEHTSERIEARETASQCVLYGNSSHPLIARKSMRKL